MSLRAVLAASALCATSASAQFVLDSHTLVDAIDDVAITPNGRLAVANLNRNFSPSGIVVYDAATGERLKRFIGSGGAALYAPMDAIVCTNRRAAALGLGLTIVDLDDLTPSGILATHRVGVAPIDLAITPDERLLVVRGGMTGPNDLGGQYIFDLETGQQVAYAPGESISYFNAPTFDVDAVVVTDQHAVLTSVVDTPAGPTTRVTIWDLQPAGGGAPSVVFETTAGTDQLGGPHDVALAPDGLHAAVRSELSVGLYRLDRGQSQQVWQKRLFGDPGPFGYSAMDSVEMSNDRIATISRWSSGGVGAQIDVFDLLGAQKFDRVGGDPHDLTLNPEQDRLLVRTHQRVLLYDLVNLPAGGSLAPLDESLLVGTHTSFGAGQDSIVATNERAVAISRDDSVADIRFFDLSQDTLATLAEHQLPDRPIDVDLSPNGRIAAVSGLTYVMAFDLATGQLLLEHDPTTEPGGWLWCDGIAINDATLVAVGYRDATGVPGGIVGGGWVTLIDLFNDPVAVCTANANSTGEPGLLRAVGSARVAENDLGLLATQLPSDEIGFFIYGDALQQSLFGDGYRCVAGQTFRLPVDTTSAGTVSRSVDYTTLPSAGAVLAGSQWSFQFLYRDRSIGAGFNATTGVAVLFED